MKIVLIDYGAGNIRSVYKSFCAVAPASSSVEVTSSASDLDNADYIVLPGVGAFGDCINGLKKCSGMIDALQKNVITDGRPFMGICVGMQLLAKKGFEYGEYEGLGYIRGNVRQINAENVKIPHMGWNILNITCPHPVLQSADKKDVYFVHSYHLCDYDNSEIAAFTEYGGLNIVAAVAKENLIGLQFHPEKSQKAGLDIISRFLNWKP